MKASGRAAGGAAGLLQTRIYNTNTSEQADCQGQYCVKCAVCGNYTNSTYYKYSIKQLEGVIMQQYVVKPNDTLYLIAKEFDVPLAQLIKANPQIENPNMIYIGQTINIPSLLPVPEQVGLIESDAVSIINDIFMGDWQSANSRVNEIRTAMNQVTPALQDALVPNSVIVGLNTAIRNLEQSIAQQRGFQAISWANRITQLIADVLDYFAAIIPPDVIRLAYFARQIIVNVEQNDWAEAYQNYRRAFTVWQELQTDLEARYSQDVTAVNQVLDDLRNAIDRRDYQGAINNASKLLSLIDTLARDFQQQNA